MSGCADCSRSGGCGGCAGVLELTQQEMAFLRLLGQVAFLPVARKADSEEPVYLEDGQERREEAGAVLRLLEAKRLISLDYDKPLKNTSFGLYDGYPIRGSIALTQRGQQVLETLEYQGFSK